MAICSDCALFGEHRGHEVSQLQELYNHRLDAVSTKSSRLLKRLSLLTEATEQARAL